MVKKIADIIVHIRRGRRHLVHHYRGANVKMENGYLNVYEPCSGVSTVYRPHEWNDFAVLDGEGNVGKGIRWS